MKKYSFLIAIFSVFLSYSQDYTGTLEPLTKDGLHSLLLSSEIRSAANDNLDYLRIKNKQNNDVPYVLITNTDTTFSSFNEFKIVSKNTIKDSLTSIVVENEIGKTQDHFTLKVSNTNVSKNYSIYGSNDQRNWFGLVENARVGKLSSKKETFVEKTITFPLNTYQFLRIDLDDKKSLPINVLKVGVYKNKFFTQEPIELANYKQETSTIQDRKVTQLHFTSENPNSIHVLSFKINTEFYLREARVMVKSTRKVRRKEQTYDKVIAEFELNAKKENTFILDNLNEKEFWIEIENQDNPPIEIERIQLFQKPIYLVANLKQNEKYELIIDKTLNRPSYDLGNFINNKTNTIDEIQVQNFSKIKNDKDKKTPFWQSSIFMWICIIIGGGIVLYFAIGLLKDLNNKEEN